MRQGLCQPEPLWRFNTGCRVSKPEEVDSVGLALDHLAGLEVLVEVARRGVPAAVRLAPVLARRAVTCSSVETPEAVTPPSAVSSLSRSASRVWRSRWSFQSSGWVAVRSRR